MFAPVLMVWEVVQGVRNLFKKGTDVDIENVAQILAATYNIGVAVFRGLESGSVVGSLFIRAGKMKFEGGA
jgi:hypothetical protein